MNRIQFFYDDDLIALQLKINEWLSSNKEIKLIETNLNSIGTPSKRAGITNTEKYVFYILYAVGEWENMLAEKSIQEMLPAKELLPGKEMLPDIEQPAMPKN